jgi:hypothetical protein
MKHERNETEAHVAGADALALALERREYERISWHVLALIFEAMREMPAADIYDALAVLAGEESRDGV